MHFLITTPSPPSPKSKIYCIHYLKGFLPSDKSGMWSYNRLTFVLILNISIKLFIQRGLIECKPVSFHLRHLFRCNIVMQRAKPKIKRHQSQDAIVPFKHQPTLLCFFHISYLGFVTTNETQIQRSK